MTVQELIDDYLNDCPKDYEVYLYTGDMGCAKAYDVTIDNENKQICIDGKYEM